MSETATSVILFDSMHNGYKLEARCPIHKGLRLRLVQAALINGDRK